MSSKSGRRSSRNVFTSIRRCVCCLDRYLLTKRPCSHLGRAHARCSEEPCYKCTSSVSKLCRVGTAHLSSDDTSSPPCRVGTVRRFFEENQDARIPPRTHAFYRLIAQAATNSVAATSRIITVPYSILDFLQVCDRRPDSAMQPPDYRSHCDHYHHPSGCCNPPVEFLDRSTDGPSPQRNQCCPRQP